MRPVHDNLNDHPPEDSPHSSTLWIVTTGSGYAALLAAVVCLHLVWDGVLSERTANVMWVWGKGWLVGCSALMLMLAGLGMMVRSLW